MRLPISLPPSLPPLPKLLRRLSRPLTSRSVRTRIIVLALIPVVGFVANGSTYLSGERDVGKAFQTVTKSRHLADASRDFKIAIAAMRIAAKDFVVQPRTLIDAFGQSQTLANRSLDRIAASMHGKRADEINALRQELVKLKRQFRQAGRRAAHARLFGPGRPAQEAARHRQQDRARHQREHDLARRRRGQETHDHALDHAQSTRPNTGSPRAN